MEDVTKIPFNITAFNVSRISFVSWHFTLLKSHKENSPLLIDVNLSQIRLPFL